MASGSGYGYWVWLQGGISICSFYLSLLLLYLVFFTAASLLFVLFFLSSSFFSIYLMHFTSVKRTTSTSEFWIMDKTRTLQGLAAIQIITMNGQAEAHKKYNAMSNYKLCSLWPVLIRIEKLSL